MSVFHIFLFIDSLEYKIITINIYVVKLMQKDFNKKLKNYLIMCLNRRKTIIIFNLFISFLL